MIPWIDLPGKRPLRFALLAAAALLTPLSVPAAEPHEASVVVAGTIDRQLADHWQREDISPADLAGDAALLRRVTLDLAGRAPTVAEMDTFAKDASPDKYAAAVRRLVEGPEFAWHFATVLDELIQGRYMGNEPFTNYLRQSVRERKGWDVLFREVLLGPWNDDARKPARLFLERRARDLDVLTVDTARAFFGVDISCARCHNHPLTPDWKREHYYGMAAFLVRTTGGRDSIGEKPDGEAKFAGKDGKERTAAMMFLSGRTVDEPPRLAPVKDPSRFSRREALVRVALEEKAFFARAFVNRVWEYFLGRGLVHPVDQMHSANPASVPSLLDQLAEDFVTSGYDIPRLATGIVLSRAYRLDSRWTQEKPVPKPEHFAVARLRPLSPRQLVRSLVVTLGDGKFIATNEQLIALDKQAIELMTSLDPRAGDFQSSTREALFVSNSEPVRKLVAAGGNNLAERLAAMRKDRKLVRTVFQAVLNRSPTAEEISILTNRLKQQGTDRRAACEDLAWALIASAEFRFNH